MTDDRSLHLFEKVGVEIEYMIVDTQTLDVRPIADQLFHDVLGRYEGDVERGEVTWSNELVAHVVELKTTEPADDPREACQAFAPEIQTINHLLARHGAGLLPGAMHPWMVPSRETKLWPHDGHEIYANFDRVFGCQGHGWSNLQSMHLNLPFTGDDEFARLHTAIRLVLPLLPGLAASSPFEEGRATGWLDQRLKHYRSNSQRIPQVAGDIIPEPVFSEQQYHECIFRPMFEAIAPEDPAGEMQHEWLNARGAIARFERGSIEIRVIDSQESLVADQIVALAVVELTRALAQEHLSSYADQKRVPHESLVELFGRSIRDADQARTHDPAYLHVLGLRSPSASVNEIWQAIAPRLPEGTREPLLEQLHRGPLARRLLASAGPTITRPVLESIVRELMRCLADNRFYRPDQQR